MILVSSMLGMSACYLVLGGCFFIIEDNAARLKAEFTTGEIRQFHYRTHTGTLIGGIPLKEWVGS